MAFVVDAVTEFRFYHATPDRTEYLPLVPGRLNILVSAYRLLQSGYGNVILRHIHHARSVFLDSGAISLLKLAEKGEATLADVHRWMERQDDVVSLAFRIAGLGVTDGVVAMMDHPCEPWLLGHIGATVAQALEWTIRNAEVWRRVELPPGWRRVYVVQGWTLEEYGYCMDAYERLGILDEIRRGDSWLAAGTTCMRRPPDLYSVYDYLRRRLGAGHLHALGIARPEWVGHMVRQGWINSADSATASIQVAFNRGPYRVQGRRRKYLVWALYAAAMEELEAEVMAKIAASATDSNGDGLRQLSFDFENESA